MNSAQSRHTQEEMFGQLYEDYYAPFCLYAKRFIEDQNTREDIVSEVFATLWDKIELLDLKSETSLAYIKVSVKNSCLNYLKYQGHKQKYEELIKNRKPLYETSPDSLYNLNDLYALLYETLEKLPEHYRTVILKSYFEDKTYAEIAQEMNLSVKSVNRYKLKAVEILRDDLKSYSILLLLYISMK